MAKSDYASMPPSAGASLAELEEAWRNPASAGVPSHGVPASEPRIRAAQASQPAFGEAPTQLVSADIVASHASAQPQARGRSPVMIVLGALGIVVLAGAGAALAVRFARPAEEPKLVVIERNANTTATPSAPASVPAATAEPSSIASSSAAPAASPSKPAGKAPAGDPLSAAFAKNQPEIEGCFRDKAANVSGAPEVSVRFTIDKEGTVQRAELAPAELAGVPLGQCILAVARKTQFPAQAAPATFRIPLRARKAP
jgi:hypothetical protein